MEKRAFHRYKIGVTVYRRGDMTAIPLVLIHGFPVDHRMWDATVSHYIDATKEDPQLSRMPIIAVEMPGAGATPIPSDNLSGEVAEDGAYVQALDDMALSCAAVVCERGFEKAIWVGLSMGGYAVLALQRLVPDVVAGIGLLDTKATADSVQARKNRLKVAHDLLTTRNRESVMHFVYPQENDSDVKKSPEFIEQFTQWINQQSIEGLAWRQKMAAGREDNTSVLGNIKVPALVAAGSLDPSSPPEKMIPLSEKISNSFFVEIKNAGHFTAVERPAQVANALVKLSSLVDAYERDQ